MKTTQSSGTRPVHQTVASKIQFETANKSIQIEFTDQKLSPHAGAATFWSFLHGSGWIPLLEKCLPHPLPKSNNHLSPRCKALGFIQGLLCGAKKLTHVAYLRRDPMVPERVGIKRGPSRSVLTRFFQGFSSAGRNLPCFRQLFGWCLDRLPSRRGGCALDLWDNLPRQIHFRVVRADSGFCVGDLFLLWESLRLRFVVAARLTRPLQSLIKKETSWRATEIEGTEVAELEHQEKGWPAATRLIVIR